MKTIRIFLVVVVVSCISVFTAIHFNNAQAAEVEVEKIKSQLEESVEIEETSEDEESEEVFGSELAVIVENDNVAQTAVGNAYEEGQDFGLVTYNGIETALAVGTTEEVLDSHKAMLHSASTPEHLVVLGHCYKDGSVFGRLYSNSKEGTEIMIQDLNGTSVKYVVSSSIWVDEETYNTSEYINKVIYEDESDLLLITCRKQDGVRGRYIVSCDLAE